MPRLTSIIINYFSLIKIFDIYLFTKINKEDNEYSIPKGIKRTVIKRKQIYKLIKEAYKRGLDILIYNFYNSTEINILNSLKDLKIIFYQHQSFLYWIYFNYNSFKSIYKVYQNSKYIISLVPFENDYLFNKWGIRSILMFNFITYDYNSIIPSDLSSKSILMIGRGQDKLKRFNLGIKSMKYIIKEISNCDMKIISTINNLDDLINLVKRYKLENKIKFLGYTSSPEIYFKNASLHIFPSISESFGYVLSEVKIYGIPSILVGLDYISIAKKGTIIIYDDKPITIAKEAIKILKDDKYRIKLGREARKSMKYFDNQKLMDKWIKLILSIYNGDSYYQLLREHDKKLKKEVALNIINNQIKLLKMRKNIFNNITLKNIENFTFMENYLN